MRRAYGFTIAVAAIALAPLAVSAQADASKAVAGGGISVPGWQGKIDKKEIDAGMVLENSKLSKTGDVLMVTTGPAVNYWNPANKATGNYTIKATFKEDKYMALNNHPHPYGIFIGGNDLGTDKESLLYCAAYGSGTFIVRGFGPAPFQVNGARPTAHAAVNKAAGTGQPVQQEIALSVKGDKVECSVNGQVVGSYDKASVLGEGKLKSTDGIYGIRFAHNTEGTVTGLSMTKN